MNTEQTPSFEDTEIVVGLVCPVGVNYRQCIHVLDSEFKKMGYTPNPIEVSGLMDNLAQSLGIAEIEAGLTELARIRARMKMGNELRCKAQTPGIMALAAIQKINIHRASVGAGEPALATVHIVSTLKRPEEVAALRQVYGAGFFLIGLHDTEDGRKEYLTEHHGLDPTDAERLIKDDADDHEAGGQRTRETYYLADVFVSFTNKRYKEQIARFVELLFSHPYHTPTRDEYAMFMAFAASLKSAQLGRQVGASIAFPSGDVVALGCNDVPRPGGGQYWYGDHDDKRDHELGEDSNDVQKQLILKDLVERLDCGHLSADEIKTKTDGALLLDITEFGRAMHAEMDALLCCARNGIAVTGCTLYTTTFPCHNCARHILGAGISRVVYIEPYAKSAAIPLHIDGMNVDSFGDDINKKPSTGHNSDKVPFESFVGIGPRRYSDLFVINPIYGRKIERKKNGKTISWPSVGKRPRLPMHPISYLQREKLSVQEIELLITNWRRLNDQEAGSDKVPSIPKSPPRKRDRSRRLA